MQITVRSIDPCDYHDDPEFPKVKAVVDFHDDKPEYNNLATVNVFLDKREIHLSELMNDAVQEAVAFLSLAISSHSSEYQHKQHQQ